MWMCRLICAFVGRIRQVFSWCGSYIFSSCKEQTSKLICNCVFGGHGFSHDKVSEFRIGPFLENKLCQKRVSLNENWSIILWTANKKLTSSDVSYVTSMVYWTNDMSHLMTKPTKWHVHPATTQVSLGIRSVWSESLLSAWRKLGSLATHWRIEKTLIRVFAGRTVILLVLSRSCSIL